MGGVGIADQLRSYYNVQPISDRRVWFPTVFFAFDKMITDAYIIFSDIEGTPGMAPKEFRLQVAWGLILDQALTSPMISAQNRSNSQPHTIARATNVTQGTVLPLVRRCSSDCDHLSVHLEKKAHVGIVDGNTGVMVLRKFCPALSGPVEPVSSHPV